MIYITYAYKPEIEALKQLIGEAGGRCEYVRARGGDAGDALDGALKARTQAQSSDPAEIGDLVVNAGFAGSLSPDLSPGEIVMVEQFLAPSTGAACEQIKWPPSPGATALRRVSCLTAEKPIEAADERDRLALATGADIVDMEGFHLQAAAKRHGVPFLSFKVISDPADETAYSAAVGQAAKWSRILGGAVHEFLRVAHDKTISGESRIPSG